VHFDPERPKCNPPPVSSSDEFNDPFSEDTGGGLLEMEGGRNIQGAKVAKGRGGRVMGYLLRVIGEEEEGIEPRIDANEHEMRRGR
jgi:hypothetical protein